jgi:cell wall-associated NlpC family hydrolase
MQGVYGGTAQQTQRPPDSTTSGATTPDQASGLRQSQRVGSAGSHAANVAISLIGVPYRYGGATTNGFDCSGLVQYAYRQAGMQLPRTTAQQFNAAKPIELRDARPGDLLFFADRSKISHVAIYLGEGQFVHAPETGRTVELGTMDNRYYRDRLIGAGRY